MQHMDNARACFLRSARRLLAGTAVLILGQMAGSFAPGGAKAEEAVTPGPAMEFQATAYCESGITKSGVPAAPGLAAADPSVLPLGTLVHVESERHRGIYRVMDTGRLVKGRIIDIYMSNLQQAIQFGRQKVTVSVLRYGAPRGYVKGLSQTD